MNAGLAVLLCCVATPAAEPPGEATGRTKLRFAVLDCALDPPAVAPGREATLHAGLVPRAGLVWHDARLVPAKVSVTTPEGWSAEPATLDIPPPDGPGARRAFVVRLAVGAEVTGAEELVLTLSYGVRVDSGPAAPDEPPTVFVENANVAIPIPADISTNLRESLPEEASAGEGAPPPDRDRTPPGAAPDDGQASPILPALFLAAAAALVMGGLAAFVRRARRERAGGE